MAKNLKDNTTVYGIILSALLIIFAIALGGSLIPYFDFPSILIVIGGTFATTTACFTYEEIKKSFPVIFRSLAPKIINFPKETLKCLKFSEQAYKKGILSLQSHRKTDYGNEFFYEAIHMIIDNMNAEFISRNLNNKIENIEENYMTAILILRKAAEIFPAMGLIGTLIGLVRMLGNINDIDLIGPAMAVALLTTFYGAVFSYIICFPLASKLERNLDDQIKLHKIYQETCISIAKKENPRYLENYINSQLSYNQHVKYYS